MGMRHQARITAFQAIYCKLLNPEISEEILFSFDWQKNKINDEGELFARLIISGVIENKNRIDEIIQENLDNWELSRISKIDHANLLLGVYSLIYQKDIPSRVTINEAVEIAKEYGKPESYKFVNGVLDKISKTE